MAEKETFVAVNHCDLGAVTAALLNLFPGKQRERDGDSQTWL